MSKIRKRKFNEVLEFCEEIGLICKSTEYTGIKSNMTFVCTRCGEDFERSFDNLKTRKSTVCSLCGKQVGASKRAFTIEEVRRYIEEESNSGCILISKEYKNSDTPIEIKCPCGEDYRVSYDKFKGRDEHQCNPCAIRANAERQLTPIEIVKELVEAQNYTLINRNHNFDTGSHAITVSCERNHPEYTVSYHKFRFGRRCPYCSSSLGERKIQKVLTNKNIESQREYRFKELLGIGGSQLRFDFAVFHKGELKLLIEFDGKQHYEPVEIFGGEKKYRENLIHDNLKNNYCIENSILLIRIPYWEFDNIESILEKELTQAEF